MYSSILQNQLAVAMEIRCSNVICWVSEIRDLWLKQCLNIRDGLQKNNPEAAEEFIRLYLSASVEDVEQS